MTLGGLVLSIATTSIIVICCSIACFFYFFKIFKNDIDNISKRKEAYLSYLKMLCLAITENRKYIESEEFTQAKAHITLLGSPKVIIAFSAVEKGGYDFDNPNQISLLILLIEQMREDLTGLPYQHLRDKTQTIIESLSKKLPQ